MLCGDGAGQLLEHSELEAVSTNQTMVSTRDTANHGGNGGEKAKGVGDDDSATTGTTAVEGTQPEVLDTQGFDGLSALMTDGRKAAKSVSSSEASVCDNGDVGAGSEGASRMALDESRSTTSSSSVSMLSDLMEYHGTRFGYCETPLDAIQINKLNGSWSYDNFHFVKYLNDDLLQKSGLLEEALKAIAPKTEEERKMKGDQSGLTTAFLKKKFNAMRDYFVQKVKLSVVSGGFREFVWFCVWWRRCYLFLLTHPLFRSIRFGRKELVELLGVHAGDEEDQAHRGCVGEDEGFLGLVWVGLYPKGITRSVALEQQGEPDERAVQCLR